MLPVRPRLEMRYRRMRASAPGQSALLMADIAESLAGQGVRYAVIGAMAAAVHGVVRASLDVVAIVALHVREALALRQSLIEEGYEVALRTGGVDDPIPGLLEIRDRYGNRVDLLLGLRGMGPELLNRTRQVRFGEANRRSSAGRFRRHEGIRRRAGCSGSLRLPGSVACPR